VAEKRRGAIGQAGIDHAEAEETNGTGANVVRQRRPRRRIGVLCFSSPGHYYPLTALGRCLQSRGHEVVYFQVADLERPIRAAGLRFRQIGQDDFPPALSARETRKSESSRVSPPCGAGCAGSNGRR
jgi:hypothetical protein